MEKNLKLKNASNIYQKMLRKDKNYWIANKKTGFFCNLNCKKMNCKKDNIEYYGSIKECLDFGYTPCEKWKLAINMPIKIEGILKEVSKDPGIKITDWEIKQKGINPGKLRDFFKNNFDITFQAYLRYLRINHIFKTIKYDEHKQIMLQDKYFEIQNDNEIFISRIITSLGPMFVGATKKGICLLEFTDRRMLETQFKRLEKYYNKTLVVGNNKYFEKLKSEINKYLNGELKVFTVPLDIKGTKFQELVWNELKNIPYGKTRSYQKQAINTGNEKAVRAVARANGDNRIAIIIPCHRVIGKDGNLTGYGGKIWRKQILLDLEK